MAQSGTLERMIGAALFNVDTYEEVERDSSLTAEAAIIVFLGAVASALGVMGIFGLMAGVSAGVKAIVAWLVWAGVTWMIGTWFMGGTATWGELLRTLGYAHTPSLLLVLGILPLVGWFIYPVVAIWSLVLGVIAIRQALDFTTEKAILTAVFGWVVVMVLRVIF